VTLSALLAGCAVGPDFRRPEPPNGDYGPLPGAADAEQRFVSDLDIPGQWWTLFGSPQLARLVEIAIAANPGIDAARAALTQARELRKAEWTANLPLLQGEAAASRNKNATASLANPSTNSQNAAYYSFYTAQLGLSYLPDVWGATARAVESAVAQEENARFQLAATTLTLSTNVVGTVVQEAALRGQLAATRRLAATQHELTEMVGHQVAIGSLSRLDLLSQQTAEAETLATLPPLEKQLAQTRDALAALLGRLPGAVPDEEFTLADLTLPRDLPVSLPSKLVEQRPDVRAAQEILHQATAAVGIALADMLPQLSITGSYGSTAFKPNQLLTPNYGFWSLGANLSQTLFDAGALLHRRRAADAAMDQAAALYRLTVIAAFQNVADCLRALEADGDAVAANRQAAATAAETFAIARQQFGLGTVSMVVLLNSEQAALVTEIAKVQAEADRYADTAGLFQALGGGWWNRPELAANPL
jgi:NodT family efflux transporter outer membrane factor (OMF) lipoprotein